MYIFKKFVSIIDYFYPLYIYLLYITFKYFNNNNNIYSALIIYDYISTFNIFT